MVRIIGTICMRLKLQKALFKLNRGRHFCKRWLPTNMNTVCDSNISLWRCFRLEMQVLSLECDEWEYYWMEQPHHFPLAPENTGRRLRDTWKNRLAGLKHCMPKLSLPWNVIWECVWKWECITEKSRWQESVPKTREERNRSLKKKEGLEDLL